ncbi:hypothetical protein [Vreelandella maris]|uniref:hypothetical protein n=1 Tax=Vreelandella maris TaxID=2729617 RepID=UPI0030EC7B74
MNPLIQLHQLADQCRQQCGFFVSASTAYHSTGGRYVSVMIYTYGEQAAHLYGETEAEVAEQLAAFIAAHRQEAVA